MGQAGLDCAVIGIPARGALQRTQACGNVGPIKVELVHHAPEQKNKEQANTKQTSPGGCTREPVKKRRQAAPGSLVFAGLLTPVQQQRGNPGITEFPESAVEKEMMKIHERGEGKKAGGKIGMKQPAGKPRPGNKKSDAAGDEGQKVAREAPGNLPGGARFFFLVVTGDPQILCGMQHRQNTAGIARLRHPSSAQQFDNGGKQKPEKLCQSQGQTGK